MLLFNGGWPGAGCHGASAVCLLRASPTAHAQTSTHSSTATGSPSFRPCSSQRQLDHRPCSGERTSLRSTGFRWQYTGFSMALARLQMILPRLTGEPPCAAQSIGVRSVHRETYGGVHGLRTSASRGTNSLKGDTSTRGGKTARATSQGMRSEFGRVQVHIGARV